MIAIMHKFLINMLNISSFYVRVKTNTIKYDKLNI